MNPDPYFHPCPLKDPHLLEFAFTLLSRDLFVIKSAQFSTFVDGKTVSFPLVSMLINRTFLFASNISVLGAS
jgi:hypothetical protein